VNQEAWPTPQDPSREPLPRVEDLPVAEQGYEQDSVRAAFDSFYRHAAQLDAALRTLEAVDSFHRQAAALRADMRTLRTAGWTQQPWSATPAYGYAGRGPREGVSPAVWRIAGEAAFLIAVAVVLGVAKLDWWLIVLVMAFAWLLVGLIEWAAARDRFAAPRAVAEPPHPAVVEAVPPGDRTEEEPLGWAAYEAADEPSDAMTMIGAPPAVEEAAPVVESPPDAEPIADAGPEDRPELEPAADEPEPAIEAVAAEALEEPEPAPEPEAEHEPEPEPEPEPAAPAAVADEPAAAASEEPKRHWWNRRRDDAEAQGEVQPDPLPRHVRVLAAEEHDAPRVLDPWEAGFDDEPGVIGEPSGSAPEPDEETGEDAAPVAADGDDAVRRRFRRR
jgi:hypothetical protein